MRFFLIFAFVGFLFPVVHAERLDSVQRLNEVTVVSNRIKLFNTGHFYTSIDSSVKAIQSSAYLGDLLSSTTLFQINSYGAGSSSVSARGMGEKRTPTIWNGFNIQSILSSGADLSELPSFFFEDIRAEMGGSSALFGSGAAGGILFLNNKQSFNKGVNGQLVSSAGSFGSYMEGGALKISTGNYSGSVKAYYSEAKNDFDYYLTYSGKKIDTTQVNASNKQYGAMMNNFWKFSDKSILNVNIWYSNSDKNIAPTLSSVYYGKAADGHQADKFFAGTGEFKTNINNVELTGRSGFFRSKLNYEKPSVPDTTESKASWSISEIEASSKILKFLSVNGGMNYTFEHGKSTSMDSISDRNRFAVFGSLRFNVPFMNISVTANGRQEIVNGDDIPFTYSVGAEISPVENVTIKGNVAKNYRLPTFNDLYYKSSYSVGNPDLKPEDGMNYELGIEFKQKTETAQTSFGANYFFSKMENWINWAARTDGILTVYNIDKANIQGLESYFQSGIKANNMELNGKLMYTYVEALNGNTHLFLTNMPKNKFNFNLEAKVYQTSVIFQVNSVGDRFYDSKNTVTIPQYSLVNTILTQNLRYKELTFSVDMGVYNITNQDYMVMYGYPMPERNYKVGLRIIF
jgi:vitamin B12 transporter